MGVLTKDVVLIERFSKGVFMCSGCLDRYTWPFRPDQRRGFTSVSDAIHFVAGIAKSFSG